MKKALHQDPGDFADYLYADRSALSRELCRMRDEGILVMNGRRLQILDLGFLQD